jgi:Host cell surface-exposed lipoprotein
MQPQPPKPPKKKHRARNVILSVIGGLVVLFIAIAAIGAATGGGTGSNSSAASSPATVPTYSSVPETPAAVVQSSSPAAVVQSSAPAAPPTSAPAAPQETASQQQAIQAAEGYLSDGQGFSYQGLIDQLDSPDGNGFSVADATFAVNHVSVDWRHQAAIAAQGYMSDGQGFSCSGLLQQLTSAYGSQFTQAQAEYAVQSVGLGSC